jgi:hypothetical protein
LRSTTEEVIDWAVRLEASLAEDGAPAGECAGLAICPPVYPGANQATILQHFQTILERNVFPSSSASKRPKNAYAFQFAWLGNGICHSSMVYRQKIALPQFSHR